MFDREMWQKARAAFDELVDLDDATRARRLDEIGEQDPDLRDALNKLLVADVAVPVDSATRSAETSVKSRDPLGIIGKNVSHFTVKDYLAAGGMGVVYTGEDLQLGRTVALKFPLPHQQLDKLIKERFVNEARSAAALDHANLCTVHEIGESEHGVFLAMPLYPGETLKDCLAREGTLGADDALNIAEQITTGLAAAHAAGIVHRDLKPGNIMLLPDGTVKVLDFGLAKIRDISLTLSHTTIGTIGYVSPEQIRGAKVDARADLWSIGVMLYEMLTGHMPFRGEHELSILHNIIHSEAPVPSEVNRKLSPALDQLVGGLLQKNPDERYPSARAFLADISALRSGGALSHRGPFWSRTARRRQMRSRVAPAVIVGAVLVIAIVAWREYQRNAAASRPTSASPAITFINNSATISTSRELIDALSPANAGKRVHLRAGTYDVDRPLTVPDGMTLEGEGVMLVDNDGRATGFRDGPHTTIKMTSGAGGDVITLGNNVTLKNVEILDVAGHSGNVIAVESRHRGDTVSATIIETVVSNPNPSTIAIAGAFGRALHVSTQNPNLGDDPAPHDRSSMHVKVVRSVIRSPKGGGGFFVFNFASNSRISFDISHSYIGGTNEANGGVSRPDQVHDSEVRVTSEGNLYKDEWADPCASAMPGWNLAGGSGAPLPMDLPSSMRNHLVVKSLNDRMEGFTTAVLATGGRRFYPEPRNAPPRDNRIDLELTGLTIVTPSCKSVEAKPNVASVPSGGETVADLILIGAQVIRSGMSAGDGNVVSVKLNGVTGSGIRANSYQNAVGSFGPIPAGLQGHGNRLEIVGDVASFMKNNRSIEPAPGKEFFSRKN